MSLFISKTKKREEYPEVLSKDNIHLFPKHIQDLFEFLISIDKDKFIDNKSNRIHSIK